MLEFAKGKKIIHTWERPVSLTDLASSNPDDCNNSVSGLKWSRIPWRDFQYWQTCLETRTCVRTLFHPSSRRALVFSRYFRSARSAFEERVRGGQRRPRYLQRGWDKGAPVRESSTRFKRRRLTPSRTPCPSISPEWWQRVVLRQRSAIRSQMKILTIVVNAVRIGERLAIDRSPREFLC